MFTRQFLADAVRGDIPLPRYGTASRHEILQAIDHDSQLRGQLSDEWRRLDPHMHEWIPCTYLCHLARRSVQSGDFRFLRLADAMRSPTEAIVFQPQRGDAHWTQDARGRRTNYVVLHAHPGGLSFRGAGMAGGLQSGDYYDGMPLVRRSVELHNAAVRVLGRSGTPLELVEQLHDAFRQHCWDGSLPINNVNAADLWRHYLNGAGGVVDPGNFGAFLVRVQIGFAAIDNNFTSTWRQLASGPGREPPLYWV